MPTELFIMKNHITLLISLFFFFTMSSQENNDFIELGMAISMDFDSNETIFGYGVSTSYTSFLNRYLALEGNIMHQKTDNFPKELETGNFGNSQYLYGEYTSKQTFSVGVNAHLVFINQQKNTLSFFAGPNISFINKDYFIGVNEHGLTTEPTEDKGFFAIRKVKYNKPALNYGIAYKFKIYDKLALGLKLNGFSPLGKKMQEKNLTIYSGYITISKML